MIGKINTFFSVKVGDGFSYIERLLGGPTGKVIHAAYRLLNDAIGLGLIRFLLKIQYLSYVLQRNEVLPEGYGAHCRLFQTGRSRPR
jgi:hypothetical protein